MIRKIFNYLLFIGFISINNSLFCEDSNVPAFEIAFNHFEFVMEEKFSISPNGQQVAYSVRKYPNDVNCSQTHLLNGTPVNCVGSRIFITHLDSRETSEIGPSQGDCWRPSWSPDGQKLAFYSNAEDSPHLWVYDAATDQSKQMSSLPIKAQIYPIDSPIWSLDGKKVYVPLNCSQTVDNSISLANSNPEEGQIKVLLNKDLDESIPEVQKVPQNFIWTYYQTTLAIIDLETHAMQSFVPSEASPPPGYFEISPTGQWLSYKSIPRILEDKFGCISFDLAVTPANKQGPIQLIGEDIKVDDSLHVYKWHPIEDKIAFIQNNKLHLVELDVNGVKRIKEICQNSNLDFYQDPFSFTEDGKKIVLGARLYRNDNDATPQTLAVITLESEEIVEISIGEGLQYIELLHANQTHLIALLNDSTTNESMMMRFDLKEDQPSRHVLWKGSAVISNFHKTKDGFLCCFEDLTNPPNIYRLSSDFTQFERMTHIDPKLDKLKAPTKVIFETTVPLYNGNLGKVRTAILLPEGTKQGDSLPGIVIFYPGSEASKSCKTFMGEDLLSIPNYLFLNEGYALIFPDVLIGDYELAGNPIQEIVDVLLPQIYHASYLGYIDINHLGIAGQSYGGYGTASVIAQTHLFRAAAAISGVYDLASLFGDPGDDYSFHGQYWSEYGQGRMSHHPWSNWMRYFNNSPYCLADKIHTPFLILHGEKDQSCNVYEAKKMFTSLKRLDREVQLAIYSDQGHVISRWNRPSAIDASKRILEFFNRRLKRN